jgi:hypothetical protein
VCSPSLRPRQPRPPAPLRKLAHLLRMCRPAPGPTVLANLALWPERWLKPVSGRKRPRRGRGDGGPTVERCLPPVSGSSEGRFDQVRAERNRPILTQHHAPFVQPRREARNGSLGTGGPSVGVERRQAPLQLGPLDLVGAERDCSLVRARRPLRRRPAGAGWRLPRAAAGSARGQGRPAAARAARVRPAVRRRTRPGSTRGPPRATRGSSGDPSG